MNILKILFEKFINKKDTVNYARFLGVSVGDNCRFLGTSKKTFGSEPYLISIGNHVTLTGDIRFITHDGGVWVFREKYPDIDVFGRIIIGNNVFVGLNSIIMPNTVIGDNVVIGAGSIVRGVLESNSVYAGTPVKKIMSIEEYENKTLSKCVYTKKLSKDEKKIFLTREL
ncbi:acyltransferase [Acinetobacter indicus]|uniref:acyltransferase n=1 Tax=Acinetobacter indicus TaxID=756892 RepID=UPI003989EFE3